MLKLGSTDINKFYLGATEINKIYLGADEVFSGGVVPPVSEPMTWGDGTAATYANATIIEWSNT